MTSRESWRDLAACKGRIRLFFGRAGERPEARVKRERAAQKLCDQCTVAALCRTLARVNRESGFWGGENDDERAAAGFKPRSLARPPLDEDAKDRAIAEQADRWNVREA